MRNNETRTERLVSQGRVPSSVSVKPGSGRARVWCGQFYLGEVSSGGPEVAIRNGWGLLVLRRVVVEVCSVMREIRREEDSSQPFPLILCSLAQNDNKVSLVGDACWILEELEDVVGRVVNFTDRLVDSKRTEVETDCEANHKVGVLGHLVCCSRIMVHKRDPVSDLVI